MADSTPAQQSAPAPRGNSGPSQTIVVQNSHGTFSRLIGSLGWLGFIVCGVLLVGQLRMRNEYFDTTGGIKERFHSGNQSSSEQKVAVLKVTGVIAAGEGFVKDQIDRIRNDDSIKAVVLRVDSPGGTVTGSDYMYHHLKKLREEKKIPIVVSMGSIAASGGYYVSMAVGDEKDSIFAEPTTTTGSIGVIIPHYDISGLLAKYDVKDDSIASHPRKQMLSMTRPIPDEHREILQAYVDESFERFKSIVKEGRPVYQKDEAALIQLATGEVFTANQALKHGLVDKIGFIEDAIDRAIELAKLNKDQTRVVYYSRPSITLSDFAGFAEARSKSEWDLASLFDLSAPRAYYLATSLPPLVASWPSEE